jgi:hypothetical protein
MKTFYTLTPDPVDGWISNRPVVTRVEAPEVPDNAASIDELLAAGLQEIDDLDNELPTKDADFLRGILHALHGLAQ